jgi:CO/xanthine dehydrogenase FAD-binding subunit
MIHLKEYHCPETIEQARKLLIDGDGRRRILAGGTHVLVSGDRSVEGVVDLRRLGLDQITENPAGLAIGAMVTLQQLIDTPLMQAYADGVLGQAARSRSVSKMIRNQATLGGEIASGEALSAMAAVILALNAKISLMHSSLRVIEACDFFAEREALLSGADIITELLFPFMNSSFGCKLERLATLPSSVPQLCVAVFLRRDGTRAVDVRLAIAGGYRCPGRIRELEVRLEGCIFNKVSAHDLIGGVGPMLDPPSDIRVSSDFRQQVAPVLIRRALMKAWQQAGGINTGPDKKSLSIEDPEHNG